jgi:kynurenine formamidase
MEKWVDFSHTYDSNMPVPDWPGVERREFMLQSFYVELNGLWQNYLSFNIHSGTHVDAPSHFDKRLASAENIMFKDLIGDCYVLPLEKSSLESIEVEELHEHKSKLEGRSIVFISTLWEEKWGTPQYEREYPFLTEKAGNFLLEMGIKVIGIDTPGPDAPLRSSFRKGSPLHKILLTGGSYIIENLCNLKEARDQVVSVFALPLKIKSATGSPTRVIGKIGEFDP